MRRSACASLPLLPLPSLLLLAAAGAGPASADTWAPPRPSLRGAPDGRHYLIVNPGAAFGDAEALHVRRREGAAPRPDLPPDRPYAEGGPRALEPEAGDELLARIRTRMPLDARCLDGGAGFLLVDTYGQVGVGPVVDRYDAPGRLLWSRRLTDLYAAGAIAAFPHSVSSVWWSRGILLDGDRARLVVLDHGWGIRRVALADGKVSSGDPADLLDLLAAPHVPDRRFALLAVAVLRPKAWEQRVRDHGPATLASLGYLVEETCDLQLMARLPAVAGALGEPAAPVLARVLAAAPWPRCADASTLCDGLAAIGRPGSLKAVPALLEALEDPASAADPERRARLLRGLRAASGADPGDAPQAWRAWWEARR